MIFFPKRSDSVHIVTHAVTRGFSFSRLLTSRIRWIYEHRYKHKHVRGRRVFLFDAFLVLVVCSIFSVLAYLWIVPPKPPALSAIFSAPQIQTGAAIPLAVHIQVEDGMSHNGVRLQWQLPEGVRVLGSSPEMHTDGSILFGQVTPGQVYTSRVTILPLYATGDVVRLGFRLEYENGKKDSFVYFASEERPVATSLVQTDILSDFNVNAVANGVLLPVRIRNTSDQTIPFVQLRANEKSDISFSPMTIGDLAPYEERLVSVPISFSSTYALLAWDVFAASRLIVSQEKAFEQAGYRAHIESTRIGNEDVLLTIGEDGFSEDLLVLRKKDDVLLSEKIAINGRSSIRVPYNDHGARIRAVGLRSMDNYGISELLATDIFIHPSDIPVSASAHYYTASGDQIGVGPHPPVIGEETRYWVFWEIGPLQASLRDIRLSSVLPQGVTATGQAITPDGGVWRKQGREIIWEIEDFSYKNGQGSALFGFEIAFTPQEGVSGERLSLTGDTFFTAIDARSGIVLDKRISPLFSENVR